MNNDEIKEFLQTTEEGQSLWQELTAPLLKAKNTILEEKRDLRARLDKTTAEYEATLSKMKGLEDSITAEKQERRQQALAQSRDSVFKEVGIAPAYLDDVKTLFEARGELDLTDDGSLLYSSADGEERPFKEAVQKWSNTTIGKQMTLAYPTGGVNSGGGALGSGPSTFGPAALDKMDKAQLLAELKRRD